MMNTVKLFKKYTEKFCSVFNPNTIEDGAKKKTVFTVVLCSNSFLHLYINLEVTR